MECRKCGNTIPDDSVFCPFCGDDVRTQERSGPDVAAIVKKKSRKFKVAIGILAVLCILLAGATVYLVVQINELTEANARLEETNDLRQNSIDYYYAQWKKVREEKETLERETDFFDSHAAIVPSENNTLNYYHKYSCYDWIGTGGFRIYNTEMAEAMGYYPCPKCH